MTLRRLSRLFACALVACTQAPPSGSSAPDYPASSGIAAGAVVPDLAVEGIREDGARGTIHLRDYFTPSRGELLVVRVHGGEWCGTCLWHAGHTRAIFARSKAGRIHVLDLVLGDRDNAPARLADADAWRSSLDTSDRVAVGADPGFSFRALVPRAGTVLPLVAVIDTRTMRLVRWASDPSPEALADDLDAALAAQDGLPAPRERDAELVDGFLHRNQWEIVKAITPPGAPPPDPSDAVADDPRAAALGKALFFDRGLSPSNAIACASCHDPAKNLGGGLPRAPGDRRTPNIALAALSRHAFWDGRADALWVQAAGPIESAREMGSSRIFALRRIAGAHADAYRAAFPAHALPDVAALPASGKPGEPAYDRLSEADRRAVTQVLVDASKAIEAYERTFRIGESAIDRYARGDFSALSTLEKQGLAAFATTGCTQCHWGARLTDDAFHVTRTPTGRLDGAADRGRADGLLALQAAEFSARGTWSDRPASALSLDANAATTIGAFKTPSLRGVGGAKGPFGHGGKLATLSDVMDSYGSGGLEPNDPRAVGAREPWLPRFGETVRWSLATFLATLSEKPNVP